MLRLLADENFNGDIVRGLLLRQPNLDLVRVQDVGLAGVGDRGILTWAAENDRILLTYDRASMPSCACEQIAAGRAMPGIFIFDDRLPIGRAIQEILLMVECSEQTEWTGRTVYLPL
jgi:Domain of unknown function (DUF5615)